ncbi:hypothetical protein TIFTF001_049580 [Ficus carica]|uniref:Uncharacterized protein n=1 Tax=Ficus carica TaxID=3494 RepID=A0AA87Z5W1_FICCA|nr:hypothetical protein TIFTF001_049580 [Ficus carica]
MSVLGTLLDEWRVALDSEAKESNQPRLLLVMSGHHTPSLDSVSYPINAMKSNLDWVHLNSYDYSTPTKTNVIYPQAALNDPLNRGINTNTAIKEWINIGFPVSKLVLGLPYHGYAWTLADPKDNRIGALASGPAVTIDGSMAYRHVKWFITSNGYGVDSTYNDTYVVNFCTIGQSWFNFDDVEAIRAKVSYAKKMGLLGYNVFQVGNDDNWVLSRAAHAEDGNRHQKKKRLLIIVLITTAMFIILLVAILGIFKMLKSSLYKLGNVSAAENLDNHASNLQILSYTTVKNATDNFSCQNKLGEGGYGPVYKGKLRRGQEIAVKRLSTTSNQGLEEFKNEVTLTANLQHINLVRVIGFCTEREEKMLVYEYMPNKSLDFYLFDPARRHMLDWNKRVIIIEGITQGLLYLQEYSNHTIVHRDLKASNILLDHQMNPKISDFSMARFLRKDELEANTGRIIGTYGYVPPEYVKKGIYSMKYDVYSFGVLLLQIISGKRNTSLHGLNENLNLSEYAFELWKEGQSMCFVESTLDDSSSSCKILRCMHVALLCVQENPVDRPSMLAVSLMLKNEATAIIRPKKPAFSIREDDEFDKEQLKGKARVVLLMVPMVTSGVQFATTLGRDETKD